jgi:hypothetical protein
MPPNCKFKIPPYPHKAIAQVRLLEAAAERRRKLEESLSPPTSGRTSARACQTAAVRGKILEEQIREFKIWVKWHDIPFFGLSQKVNIFSPVLNQFISITLRSLLAINYLPSRVQYPCKHLPHHCYLCEVFPLEESNPPHEYIPHVSRKRGRPRRKSVADESNSEEKERTDEESSVNESSHITTVADESKSEEEERTNKESSSDESNHITTVFIGFREESEETEEEEDSESEDEDK